MLTLYCVLWLYVFVLIYDLYLQAGMGMWAGVGPFSQGGMGIALREDDSRSLITAGQAHCALSAK